MKKHSKHSKLTKPSIGEYARNEWAILGAPCGVIESLIQQIVEGINSEFKIGYLDASHKEEDLREKENPYFLNLEERGSSINVFHKNNPSSFSMKGMLNEIDIAIINGNHFKANQQIVILDPKKKESLERKQNRLTDVILVLNNGADEIPDFLKDKITEIPYLDIKDIAGICDYLKTKINDIPLFGLILNGGKSTRMGVDKSTIHYHGKSQLDYLQGLMSQYCEETFVSVATGNKNDDINSIEDSFLGLGAYGGILSAFRKNPNVAWLVIAIDMPNINNDSLNYLISNRNISKTATAFLNPETNFPDPLFTIFEPKSYSKLLHYLSLGYACPRKMLINEDVNVIELNQVDLLLNINTPEEKEAFLKK